MTGRLLFSLTVALGLFCFAPLRVGAEEESGAKLFKIGVAAVNGKEDALRHWGGLAKELERALPGAKIEISPLTYQELEQAVKKGALHYLLVGPTYYVDLEVKYGVSRLATLVRATTNGPLFSLGGVIAVRGSRKDLMNPQDVKGKRVVGADPLTIGGWLSQMHEFSKLGVGRDDFKSTTFLPTYEEALVSVLEGRADAAFVRTGIIEQMLRDGRIAPQEIKTLRFATAPVGYPLEISTRSYPEWAFAKTLAAPDDYSKRVILALLSLPSNSMLRQSAGVEGFSVPQDYGEVHELLRSQKVGPYASAEGFDFPKLMHGHGLLVGGAALIVLAIGATAIGVATMNRRLAASRVQSLRLQGDLEGMVAARTRELEAEVERRRQAEEMQTRQARQVKESLVKTVKAVALTVEMRDPYMAGHQQRVACLAQAIAAEMNLSADLVESIYLAALVHDIGMIYVPSEITNRPGPLSELEYEIVKNHPRIGHDIMATVDLPWPIADIVLNHHRRLDGSGYPADVEGDIPLEARILEVADVVEAMSSHRPYRPALGIDRALQEIEEGRGVKFDADVVDACLRLVREKGDSIWKQL